MRRSWQNANNPNRIFYFESISFSPKTFDKIVVVWKVDCAYVNATYIYNVRGSKKLKTL